MGKVRDIIDKTFEYGQGRGELPGVNELAEAIRICRIQRTLRALRMISLTLSISEGRLTIWLIRVLATGYI